MLQITEMEPSVIRQLKVLLNKNLDKRFPVDPLHICSFLLDPSQLKVDIDRYLTQNQSTKESVLFNMIKKFKINHALQVSSAQNIPKPSSPSSAASTSTTLSPLLKRHLSIECLRESP
jgi:hypothetical protein